MENFEVITTTSKEQRDQMFKDFRNSDDPLERQVVKFSGARPLMSGNNEHIVYQVRYTATGKGGVVNYGKPQPRPAYESTWSVAYPRT